MTRQRREIQAASKRVRGPAEVCKNDFLLPPLLTQSMGADTEDICMTAPFCISRRNDWLHIICLLTSFWFLSALCWSLDSQCVSRIVACSCEVLALPWPLKHTSQWEGMPLNLGHFQEIAQTMLFVTLEVQMTRRKDCNTSFSIYAKIAACKNRQADETAKWFHRSKLKFSYLKKKC